MNVPRRTCVACRTTRPQAELLRVRAFNGQVVTDMSAQTCAKSQGVRALGRSAYMCPARACFEQAVRRGGLARAFKSALAPQAPALKVPQAPALKVPQAPALKAPQVPQAPALKAPQAPALKASRGSARRSAGGERLHADAGALWADHIGELERVIDLLTRSGPTALPRIQRLAALAATMRASAGRAS